MKGLPSDLGQELRRRVRGGFVYMGILLAAAGGVARAEPIIDSEPHVDLGLETPKDGAVIADAFGLVFISGRAIAHSEDFESLNVVVVIDQSDSTSVPSGKDVNGDGKVHTRCEERSALFRWFFRLRNRCLPSPDSVLAAELAAVRTLLLQLDPRSTRVGLAAFSGDAKEGTPDARIVVQPTGGYERVEAGLRRIEAQGPLDWTNMEAGIRVGTSALRESRAQDRTDQGRARGVMLLLSDGTPGMPTERKTGTYGFPNTRRERQKQRRVSPKQAADARRRAVDAAGVAAGLGFRIDTYGIGSTASKDDVLGRIAKMTGGRFRSVAEAGDLPRAFEKVDFSEVEELSIRNVTNGSTPEYAVRNADGSFSALVEMDEGLNEIEVYARSMEGAERTVRAKVFSRKDGRAQQLRVEQATERTRLLEQRLNNLRQRNLTMQQERDGRVRKELELQLKEKADAERRGVRIDPEE